jgi:hypothetical protein
MMAPVESSLPLDPLKKINQLHLKKLLQYQLASVHLMLHHGTELLSIQHVVAMEHVKNVEFKSPMEM